MALDFDPRNDLADVADGLSPVTVTRPGGSAGTEVTHALRRPTRTREAQESGGRYTAGDVVWHLPAAELTTSPRPGDVIVDEDGRRWTVLEVQKAALGGRWRCTARNLAVVHGLDQYVDVEKATFAKGAGGADRPTWHVWKTGLRARIQPEEVRVDEGQERLATTARFKVFLADEVPLDQTHRLKGPDGSVYRVARYRKAERIDALVEIDVTRVE